jgi:hypothetical protein
VLPEEANKVFALGEPALEFPRENQRYYPQGSLAANVLGYVDEEGKGHVGMEQVLEPRLLDPAQRGTPVALSIDSRAQGALEDELLRGMQESNAKGAAGIVLDVDSGEVVALASLPSFNPNRSDRAFNDLVFNRVSNQVYELGSTFKPITIAAAIDAGVVTDLSVRYPAAPLHIAGRTIHDSHNFGASLNVPEALIHSSNIVTAQVADKLGGPLLKQTMMALHMNQRPTIELPARVSAVAARREQGRRLEPDHHDDGQLWPRHCRDPAAPGLRLCRAGQRRHLAPGHAVQGRSGAHSRWHARVQGFHQRAHPPALADDRGRWHGPQGRCLGLSRGRQDRLGRKAGQRRLSQDLAGGDVRRCVPDGQAALRGHRHAR